MTSSSIRSIRKFNFSVKLSNPSYEIGNLATLTSIECVRVTYADSKYPFRKGNSTYLMLVEGRNFPEESSSKFHRNSLHHFIPFHPKIRTTIVFGTGNTVYRIRSKCIKIYAIKCAYFFLKFIVYVRS